MIPLDGSRHSTIAGKKIQTFTFAGETPLIVFMVCVKYFTIWMRVSLYQHLILPVSRLCA
jgi:hypothetical protein